MSPVMPESFGPSPRDANQQFWDPQAQTMPREKLRALQDERLIDLVRRIFETPVPMFKRKLIAAGITDWRAIKGVDDLNSIPLTVKQDLRDSEAAVPPFGDYRFVGRENCVRIGQSTGTTGTPTHTLLTRKDIWIEYESGARNWWRNGWRPGQVITHAHPAYMYGGGVTLAGSIEYFGALNLWVAPPDTDELAEQGLRVWERIKPDVSMVAFSLGRFAEVAEKLGMDGTGLPQFELKGFGEKGLALMTAGFECYANSGGPCGVEPGGHVHEDWAIVQAVDPKTGRDVPAGEWGNLVVTTLDRDNGLLRYDLEEAASMITDPCSCGETSVRGFWGGRFKDFLDCQGKYFQVNEIESALRSVRQVRKPSLEYVVVKPDGSDAPLVVRVEIGGEGGDFGEVAGKCAEAIMAKSGVRAAVEILDRESIARSGYKSTRLVER